jgi:isocitrate dehydrogenase (NAD+)
MTTVHHVLVFPGDGIGPEIVRAAQEVVAASGVQIHWTTMEAGYEARDLYAGAPMTEEHLRAFERTRVLFKGPQTVPPGEDYYVTLRGRRFTSPNQALRKLFDLYANLRPAPRTPGARSRFPEADLVVVRENTEDLYTGEEHWTDEETVEAIKRTTRGASRRIAHFALRYARQAGRRRVTIVHKANVLKQSDGLFLDECRAVARKYPDIRVDDHLCDSLLAELAQRPEAYDVLLCQNLFGDLLSDLAGGLIGGLGLCPSANLGDNLALFEPCHGSAPDIAGQGIANPTSQIRCAILLLDYLGEHLPARRVERALHDVILEGRDTTPDLGGSGSTDSMASAIGERVATDKAEKSPPESS